MFEENEVLKNLRIKRVGGKLIEIGMQDGAKYQLFHNANECRPTW